MTTKKDRKKINEEDMKNKNKTLDQIIYNTDYSFAIA